jgi:opine dehydrogenase
MKNVAVLGGGNGAHAMAADLTLKGFKVFLFSRSQEKLKPARDHGGIVLIDASGERFVPIHKICETAEEALKEAEVIVVAVAAMAHEGYAKECTPFLKSGQILFLTPGSTGGALTFRKLLRDRGVGKEIPIGETNVLTYICRLVGPAKAKITARLRLQFGVHPSTRTEPCFKIFKELFPENDTTARKNVLESSLTNFNAVLHPPGMILNAGWIEFTKGNFSYYCEGGTPAVAQVVEALDSERMGLCGKIDYKSDRFMEFFFKAGATSEGAFKSGSMYRVLQESEANRFIRAPEDLSYRFLTEDVPYGLVPMAYLGKLWNVPTTAMNALIVLTSAIHKTDYWETGWTLEKMGIQGMSLKRLLKYVENGQ